MATGTANEAEYVSIFFSFYRKVNSPVSVVFKGTNKEIALDNVSFIRRIGQRGMKADLVVYYIEKGIKKTFKISIKDNTSIYWGSEDRYIRAKYASKIFEKVKSLQSTDLVKYDEASKHYKLLGKLAMDIDTASKNKTVFGVENLSQRVGNENYNWCDIVIRGEIMRRDVIEDVKNKTLTFKVKRIYETHNDIPPEEEPVLFIYNEGGARPRSTFNTTPKDGEEDVKMQITQLKGIRGSFRSKQNALYETKTNGTWL